MSSPTAAILLIGNELLSGRTQDKNAAFIAKQLGAIGVRLKEVRMVPDEEARIIEAINALRHQYTYLFTTGGIGPTHDDITSACVAKALGQKLVQHPEATARLERFYAERGEELNEARKRMAQMPEAVTLIDNPISAAPGYCAENVYVMAGIPSIMQIMLEAILPTLTPGKTIYSQSLSTDLVEGDIAEKLADIAAAHPTVDIGSYPHLRGNREGGKFCVTLVVRGEEEPDIVRTIEAIKALALSLGGNLLEDQVKT